MTTAATVKELSLEALTTETQKPAVLNPWARYMGCLIGRVYNHPRLSDGKVILTSRVMNIDEKLGYARTRNTRYRLVNKRTVKAIMRLRYEMRAQ